MYISISHTYIYLWWSATISALAATYLTQLGRVPGDFFPKANVVKDLSVKR